MTEVFVSHDGFILGLLAAASSSTRDTKNMWPISEAMGIAEPRQSSIRASTV
jgi:hypothetical protein